MRRFDQSFLLSIINFQRGCAEVVSVIAMMKADDPECKHDTLKYRLLGERDQIGTWGHEYVRHLSNQIVDLWVSNDFSDCDECKIYFIVLRSLALSDEAQQQKADYIGLVDQIIPYLMEHNAESEAIDLCIEIERLHFLGKYTSQLNFQRICLYLASCVPYIPDPDNAKVKLLNYLVIARFCAAPNNCTENILIWGILFVVLFV